MTSYGFIISFVSISQNNRFCLFFICSFRELSTIFFTVELIGEDSKVEVISRSVARDESYQAFNSTVIGKNRCFGRVECDAILMDNAKIKSTPEILAEDTNATLVHEAAIGKIAGEQIVKLQTLGLTEKEAEDLIIKGFLR